MALPESFQKFSMDELIKMAEQSEKFNKVMIENIKKYQIEVTELKNKLTENC